jgi:hypothetical protein
MAPRFASFATRAGITVATLALIASTVWSDSPYVSPSQARLKADVTFLAADAQEGRAPGTQGIEACADYIARSFKESGLKPAPDADGFFQPFTIRGGAKLDQSTSLAFKGPGDKEIVAPKGTFQPLAIGSGGKLEGVPIVFAGYGISAKDEAKKLDYNDYAGIDVKDKAVLIIRREPQLDDENSPFGGKQTTLYATFTHKATNAFQHGAAAVLLVNDLAGLKKSSDPLIPFKGAGDEENSPIPFVMMSREEADKLLTETGQPKLEMLEKDIDAELKPKSRLLEGWTLSTSFKIERKALETKNVVGVLEGSGPLAEETIVVGAHYDHLGNGGAENPGSLAFFSRNIHNGADDNASGTALVMELARRLAKRADPLPRRIVFMAFSGEEKGLLGSRHYVEHPLIPLDKTVMMINFDMVGRLNDKSEMTVMGTGSMPGLEQIVDALGADAGFKIKKVKGASDGFGGSDHESFYQKNVPILFPFTGLHADYHRPSDDSEKINFAGMARIADFGELLILDVARRQSRPVFTKSAEPAPNPHGGAVDPGRIGMGAYLGTVPDYGAEDKGVKLSAVREGSPAEKGGIKGGDVIIAYDGKPIATIYDYTDSLGRSKPGDKVDIVVKRDGKDVTLKITIGSKPGP